MTTTCPDPPCTPFLGTFPYVVKWPCFLGPLLKWPHFWGFWDHLKWPCFLGPFTLERHDLGYRGAVALLQLCQADMATLAPLQAYTCKSNDIRAPSCVAFNVFATACANTAKGLHRTWRGHMHIPTSTFASATTSLHPEKLPAWPAV